MANPADLYRRNYSVQPPADAPDYKSTRLRSPRKPLIWVDNTPTELTGPMFTSGDIGAGDHDLLSNFSAPGESPIGERIILHGRILDENAKPVRGALVEIWQANAGGRYRHRNDSYLAPLDPNFGGCGRTLTDDDGNYTFLTVKPGAYPWPNDANSWRPAHIHFSLFGSAFAQRLVTQCYFEGDPLIPLCPIVRSIPDQGAIDRLSAKLDMEATIPFDRIGYRFDIVLRGRFETPFEEAK